MDLSYSMKDDKEKLSQLGDLLGWLKIIINQKEKIKK
jgi:hypothetical protein